MLRILPTRIPVYLIVIILLTMAISSHAGGPVITSFTPAGAYIGDSITITGKGFTGATEAKFNGVVQKSFAIISDSTIYSKVPSGAATGYIEVVSPAGTATSATKLVIYVPEITSFSPTSGIEGKDISISGKYFAGATAVKFYGVTASSFHVNSATAITANVPAGATTGKITVVAPGGTGTSATDFMVAPNITTFSPLSGIVGMDVTIYGTTFTGVSAVRFNGTLASSITVLTSNGIRATVPAGASTGKIVVTTPSGNATSSETFAVLPAITGFTPTGGKEGDSVTISGSSLNTVTSVLFNGTQSSYVTNSATSIRATVPIGATTGKITVVAPDGTGSSSTNFIVTPKITSFSPSVGIVGTVVSINGTNFGGVSAVSFNGTLASSVTVQGTTFIQATVPAGASTGKIVVTNPGGTSTSAANFIVCPKIISFTPTIGRVGDSVTISGSTFFGVTAVLFNGIESSYITNSSTSISATVPMGASHGKITVAAAGNAATSETDFKVLPFIASVTPTSGQPMQNIYIDGKSFTGVNRVEYNGSAADFGVDSDTRIRTRVPKNATTGKITLYTPDGSTSSDFEFTVNPAPVINYFTPMSGKTGQEVVITGAQFHDVVEVYFEGGLAQSYTVNNDTEITAIVPQRAVTGEIIVTTRAMSNPAEHLYAHSKSVFGVSPSITSFAPASGKVGDTVAITGSGFFGDLVVRFNDVIAYPVTIDGVTSLRVIVPTGATTGKIKITNSGGYHVYSNTDFIVYEPASLEVTTNLGTGYIGLPHDISLRYDLVGPHLYGGWLQMDDGGRAVLRSLQPGSYSLRLSGSHWLKRVVNDIAVDGVSYISTTLVNGDADGDNQVNLFDFVVLDSKFGSAFGMADLDGSGTVNLFDYVMIDTNFGALGD